MQERGPARARPGAHHLHERAAIGGPALGLCAVLVILGIGAETMSWGLLPVWYHLVFILLLVPATLLGARRRRPSA